MVTLADICHAVEGELRGNNDANISGIAPLNSASNADISFLSGARYLDHLKNTKAGVVLLKPEFAEECPVDCIQVADPYLAYAKVTALFNDSPPPVPGVHPSAVIGENVQMGKGVSIAANSVIGNNVTIGDGSAVGACCAVGDGASLGRDCRLKANVTMYHNVHIGDRVELHSGCVIGSDGFGYAPASGGWQKIHQLGSVRIGSDVSIGASTAIDRGAITDTIIGNGVIIDNQVHIAHNVEIGDNTAIAGCVGIAGSTRVGANCTMGGGVRIAGHLVIGDGVHLTGMTLTNKSISKPGTYSSGTTVADNNTWRKNAVRFQSLDQLFRRVAALEKEVADKQ
ncbi:MAG: UDP-3-O-(3-hydroxymyristoyl)glucosamine N-acyltransferase [Pseudomonadales bacterium]